MKIAFTGPESSGKTDVSKAISEHFDAQWFSEYARTYLSDKDGGYNFHDIEKIAVQQDQLRQESQKGGMGIYDTENIVLYIWSTFKFKKCAPKVQLLMENQQFEHYFLCNPEGILWEYDPLRENPNQREELFNIYLHQLQKLKVDFTILEGDFQQRKNEAIQTIEKL